MYYFFFPTFLSFLRSFYLRSPSSFSFLYSLIIHFFLPFLLLLILTVLFSSSPHLFSATFFFLIFSVPNILSLFLSLLFSPLSLPPSLFFSSNSCSYYLFYSASPLERICSVIALHPFFSRLFSIFSLFPPPSSTFLPPRFSSSLLLAQRSRFSLASHPFILMSFVPFG